MEPADQIGFGNDVEFEGLIEDTSDLDGEKAREIFWDFFSKRLNIPRTLLKDVDGRIILTGTTCTLYPRSSNGTPCYTVTSNFRKLSYNKLC